MLQKRNTGPAEAGPILTGPPLLGAIIGSIANNGLQHKRGPLKWGLYRLFQNKKGGEGRGGGSARVMLSISALCGYVRTYDHPVVSRRKERT